ncbi:MAG: hypothetical protein HFE97_00815, partial [Oscillospiraceae bacterium]|nr:hypothetical protein [Oscillospiraceae bacterium]
MKKFGAVLVITLLIGLTACKTSMEKGLVNMPKEETITKSCYEYVESPDNMETILQYTTHIVKASLVSVEKFTDSSYVYLFNVEKDYIGNASAEIHMYDDLDERYVIGHTYYLILDGTDNALFPHTIYTTVYKDLILDITANMQGEVPLVNDETTVKVQDMESLIYDTISSGIVGEKISTPITISDITSVAHASEEADLILEISVSDEHSMNPYASVYQIEIVSVLKGLKDYSVSIMNLPPNLDPDGTYYIFLDRIPGTEDDYALSFRQLPVVPVTEEATQSLSL